MPQKLRPIFIWKITHNYYGISDLKLVAHEDRMGFGNL